MLSELYINVHYNQNFVDLNNIHKMNVFNDTTDNIIKKQNIHLLRKSVSEIINQGNKDSWTYFRVQKNELQRKDSVLGFKADWDKSSFVDGGLT